LRAVFELGQRLGIDLLPRHFYSEIPDIGSLRREPDWKRAYTMTAVPGADIEQQFSFVNDICTPEMVAYLASSRVHPAACSANGHDGFGVAEADFLHAFVRKIRPKGIVQVGWGVSTAVILGAAIEAAFEPQIECIEPYPNQYLISLRNSGRIQLVNARAES